MIIARSPGVRWRRFDDPDGFQFGDQFRRFIALQLNGGERNELNDPANFFGRLIDEKADGRHEGGNGGDDLIGIVGGDASAGGGVENDADGIGAGLCCGCGGVLGTADYRQNFYSWSRAR